VQKPLTVRRWSRAEYGRLVDLGVLNGEPIELIGGQLVVAEPQGNRHAMAVGVVGAVLNAALPRGWIVRMQAPIALDDESEPEPDVAVVAGTHGDYRTTHPKRAALVVEVADASLVFDRGLKAGLYARGGVEDYWIVNLIERAVEVYRDPAPSPNAPCGWHYRSIERLVRPAVVSLLALPTISDRRRASSLGGAR
jgi:Uma2 family endonuclease